MRRAAFGVMGAMLALLLAPAASGCPTRERFAGTIVEPPNAEVRVDRAGQSLTFNAAVGELCTDDVVHAGETPLELALQGVDGNVHVASHTTYLIPSPNDVWVNLLRGFSLFVPQEQRAAKPPVSMGGEPPLMFTIAGLDQGRAVISSSAQPLYVPISSGIAPTTAQLIDPSGRAVGAPVTIADHLAIFPGPRRPGQWRIEVHEGALRLEGVFTVADAAWPARVSADTAADAALTQRERDLAIVCTDVGRYGLEGLRRTAGADPDDPAFDLLRRWSDPDSPTFCAEQR